MKTKEDIIRNSQVETLIIEQLESLDCASVRDIKFRLGAGVPSISLGKDEIFNALRRLERRQKVRVNRIVRRGHFALKMWELVPQREKVPDEWDVIDLCDIYGHNWTHDEELQDHICTRCGETAY